MSSLSLPLTSTLISSLYLCPSWDKREEETVSSLSYPGSREIVSGLPPSLFIPLSISLQAHRYYNDKRSLSSALDKTFSYWPCFLSCRENPKPSDGNYPQLAATVSLKIPTSIRFYPPPPVKIKAMTLPLSKINCFHWVLAFLSFFLVLFIPSSPTASNFFY